VSQFSCYIVGAVSLLSACSAPDGHSKACSDTAEPVIDGLCSLPSASAAHVQVVLGLSGLTPPRSPNTTAGITACSFCGDGSPLIHFQRSSTASTFAAYRHSLEIGNSAIATDYPGFGDEAFTLLITLDGGVVETCLGARRGGFGLLVCAFGVAVERMQALEADLFRDLGA
jgi:hypothetical protein